MSSRSTAVFDVDEVSIPPKEPTDEQELIPTESAVFSALLQIERNTCKGALRTTRSSNLLINFVELYSFSTGVHSGPV
jgi:hypothetical protein